MQIFSAVTQIKMNIPKPTHKDGRVHKTSPDFIYTRFNNYFSRQNTMVNIEIKS